MNLLGHNQNQSLLYNVKKLSSVTNRTSWLYRVRQKHTKKCVDGTIVMCFKKETCHV